MIGDIIISNKVHRKLLYGSRRTWLRTQKGRGYFTFTRAQHSPHRPIAYCPDCKIEIPLGTLVMGEFCPQCVVLPTEIEFRGWF